MIRIREISLPPEHSVHQLPYEAARLLKISNSKVRRLNIGLVQGKAQHIHHGIRLIGIGINPAAFLGNRKQA